MTSTPYAFCPTEQNSHCKWWVKKLDTQNQFQIVGYIDCIELGDDIVWYLYEQSGEESNPYLLYNTDFFSDCVACALKFL